MKDIHQPQSVPESDKDIADDKPAVSELRSGFSCPRCGRGRLEYNGMIELECPECGFTLGGGGCT